MTRELVTGRLADVGQPTQVAFGLWQSGFYDFNVYSDATLVEKLSYIHNNPVRSGLVSVPEDYKWSTCNSYFIEKVERERRGGISATTN